MTTPTSEPFSSYLGTPHPPLVSVIVTAYEKGSFIEETVRSFLTQSHRELEVIVVDDGSSDDTATRVERLAQTDSRVRLVSKKNGGVSDARNVGVMAAHGRAIVAIDGDDLVTPEYVATALATLRQTGANCFCPSLEHFGLKTGIWRPNQYDPYLIRYDNCVLTASLFDRDLWIRAGGWKRALLYAEDWEFWVNCSRYGLQVVQVAEPLFRYRVTDSGLAARHTRDRWQDCFCVVAIANHDLYPVEEILSAHEEFTKSAPASLASIERLATLHPDTWLGALLTGIIAEKGGDLQKAVTCYEQALQRDQHNWQGWYRLAEVKQQQGDRSGALGLLHVSRVLRPDLARFVNPRIEELQK